MISSEKGLFILSSTVYDTSNSTSGTGVSRRRLDVPSRVAERPPLPRPTAWPPCAWTGFFYGTWKSVSCKRCTSNAGVGQYHIFGRDFNSGPSHSLNPIKHLWRFYILRGQRRKTTSTLLHRQQRGIRGHIFCNIFHVEDGGEIPSLDPWAAAGRLTSLQQQLHLLLHVRPLAAASAPRSEQIIHGQKAVLFYFLISPMSSRLEAHF